MRGLSDLDDTPSALLFEDGHPLQAQRKARNEHLHWRLGENPLQQHVTRRPTSCRQVISLQERCASAKQRLRSTSPALAVRDVVRGPSAAMRGLSGLTTPPARCPSRMDILYRSKGRRGMNTCTSVRLRIHCSSTLRGEGGGNGGMLPSSNSLQERCASAKQRLRSTSPALATRDVVRGPSAAVRGLSDLDDTPSALLFEDGHPLQPQGKARNEHLHWCLGENPLQQHVTRRGTNHGDHEPHRHTAREKETTATDVLPSSDSLQDRCASAKQRSRSNSSALAVRGPSAAMRGLSGLDKPPRAALQGAE